MNQPITLSRQPVLVKLEYPPQQGQYIRFNRGTAVCVSTLVGGKMKHMDWGLNIYCSQDL